MMPKDSDNIRIAITSDSIIHRNYLQKTMEHSGIEVVLNDSLTEKFMAKLELSDSDVVLFDIEAIEDEHIEYLDQLLEQSKIPVIINDASALTFNEPKLSSKWNDKLLKKIADITGRNNWKESNLSTKPKSDQASNDEQEQDELAKNLWVLGASLGGPDAVKRFLEKIPKDLPVAFILAQHLGENFVSILAEQLDRYTDFSVKVATHGHVIKHQEVLVTPTNKNMTVNPIGAIELSEMAVETKYTPCINNVIKNMASRYKSNAGAIIFSGMCDDGVIGCESLEAEGGHVWIQDPESCVISAMPESVSKKVKIDFIGTPETLAEQLVSYYGYNH